MTPITIIGGGPAGYVAAITAARQGKEVILIEQALLGGTCLNEGCMPTKSLLQSADTFQLVKNAASFGVRLPSQSIEIDWNAVQQRKNTIVTQLVQGIQYLMKKNKIKVIRGTASFLNRYALRIENAAESEHIEVNQVIIASGSEPIFLPFAPFDGEWIIDSSQAMHAQSIPSSLLIIGGGVIGCEFASIYGRMGTKVTIVEMAEQLLPGEDEDISSVLHKELESQGATLYTSTTVKDINIEKKKVVAENNAGIHEFQPDCVLVSIGRKPRLSGLGLENIGVDYTKQGILVDEQLQTSVPKIYACGDVIGGIQLAHVAFHEGTVAALNACGTAAKTNYRAVPRCIYTHPEIASVGLTEKQARDQYGDIKIGEFPFTVNGKALISGERMGKVKVLVEPRYHEIVGLSIVGPHATELIGQGTLMLHAELTTDVMEHLITAHPTLSEAVHEALLSAVGHAVHV
ncbi:dihydrolipoyl dehydrogenase [Bacillus canaveralius]|uniref:Dihydrolipoyl dehydrogenase n=1 Tax=Bacillus canaveralius TaxID=1403243 RepID=A0A2N5GJC6_9BACI|nr:MULTISPECIES: dihydrolipoyl dehydrogenase [Bacillus]PLR81294.1 dihydrolipoyl dehydrogenase [Bacillus canaveralius]PLR86487.1 dihydrolipoyl dehydrogenase [Bacillus sp. V33-4]PLS00512.1 dihydrolipoyl dehydrogenase [Bacillus canaveralius]